MIHTTAVVESGAELGQDVSVGPFAYVEAGARLGDGCVIGAHAAILRHACLGARCRVHAGAVLGDLPQDLGFKGGESFVRIGDDCVLREGVTVHRGTQAGTETKIGNRCYLMASAHVAHNVTRGDGVILANGVMLGGYVQIGDKAFLSGNCMVHQFTRVGRLAMMGGGSGTSKDVPPFCTVRPLGFNRILGLNVVGMRRAGLTPAQRAEARAAFKLLYRSGLSVGDAVRAIRDSGPKDVGLEFGAFIEESRRGICGAERAAEADGAEDDGDA